MIPTLEEMGFDLASMPEFKPMATYDVNLDRLILLLEDVGYVSRPFIPGVVDILMHPAGTHVVGVQIWGFGRNPRGADILKNLPNWC